MSRDPATDGVVVLLGQEAFGRDAGKWSAFGGHIECGETVDVLRAAAREGAEESLGILGTPERVYDRLSTQRVVQVRGQHNAVHFLLWVAYAADVAAVFQNLRCRLQHLLPSATTYSPWLEKANLCWVPLTSFDNASHALPLRDGFSADVPRIAHAAQTWCPAQKSLPSPCYYAPCGYL